MDARSRNIVAGIAVVSFGAMAYALYFDYKRRNDTQFRKQLRKEKKRVDKTKAQIRDSAPPEQGGPITTEALKEILRQIQKEEVPQTPQEKEVYFLHHVGIGEQQALQGTNFHLQAAMSFFRALRVYPSPVELMMIYQKTVPEPIFKIVMDLSNLENLDHSEGYYRVFPPKSYNVAIEQREASSTHVTRKVPILTKDVKKGETIYTEHPAVTVLDYDLLQSGSHCARCLKAIPSKVKAVKYTDSLLPATFCSQQCKSFAEDEYLSLIFTGKPVLPSTLTPIAPSPEAVDDRRRSQAAYLDYLKGADRKYGQGKSTRSLLTALFIGRQVTSEVQKIIDSVPNSPATPRAKTSKDDYTHADPSPTGTFNLAEHVERLRYLEVALAPDEPDLITAVLSKALPGLEPFVNGQSLAILSGKVTYNAFGVYFGEGRDSKPNAESRPEDMQRTRTPVGTSRQVGSALYTLSSYLTHSCEPAARVTYPKGTAELHLVAERDLAKGDELTVAYIDVSPRGGESAADSRRRRMIELAYGWRFRCVCSRCEQDAPSQEKKGGKNTIEPKDESKEDIPEPKGLRNPLQGQV